MESQSGRRLHHAHNMYTTRALTAAALMLTLVAGTPGGQAKAAEHMRAPQPSANPTDLHRISRADGLTRVLVTLKTGFQPEGSLSPAQAMLQRSATRIAQQNLLAKLDNSRYTLVAAYEIFPVIAMVVDAATLETLQSAPEVTSVQEDIPVPPADAQSNALVKVNVPWSQGYDGTGWAVAILDTGVQTSHPYFAAKVIAEACFSTTDAGQSAVSVCPNGQSTSVAGAPGQAGTGSGVNCNAGAVLGGCEHGTHVAGIAVGRDYVTGGGGPGFDGIARGANLITLQVFSRFTTAAQCGASPVPCILSFGSDQLAALQYLYATIRPAFNNIAAANMSLGGGTNTSTCDAGNAALKSAIDTLRSANIATVIAAGNNGATNALSAPACISTAVSVGATDDSDTIASFSNQAPFMSLFAPGVNISSSVPVNAFESLSGTSMAAPLVAGAWALVMQKNPAFSVAQVLDLLQTTGKPIPIFGGTQISRVRLGDAFGVPTLQLNAAKGFSPNSIGYGDTTTLSFVLSNPNAVALNGISFTDNYPGGVTNFSAHGAVSTCGGSVVAAPFASALTLTGGTLPANGSCTITVHVTATGGGILSNLIPAQGIASANGGENDTAVTGTLTIQTSNLMVQDGGFERGTGLSSPWQQSSTNFGTPLCSVATCGAISVPRTGTWMAWFGGTHAAETATLTQTRLIDAGAKRLTFYLWWADAPDPAATFKVYMDGVQIFSLAGANSAPYAAGYTRVAVDVSAYADGNTHALKFEGVNVAGSASTNVFLDEVALTNLPPSLTVRFNVNGGSGVGNQIVVGGGTATPPPAPVKAGSVFSGWYADTGQTTVFDFSTPLLADTVVFAKWAPQILDIDGNGIYDALTDGLMTIRQLSGMTGASITAGALGAGALRSSTAQVETYLSGIQAMLDVDGDGQVSAASDGLLIIRYLFGLRGAALIDGALGINATRTSAPNIEAYIQSLMP